MLFFQMHIKENVGIENKMNFICDSRFKHRHGGLSSVKRAVLAVSFKQIMKMKILRYSKNPTSLARQTAFKLT